MSDESSVELLLVAPEESSDLAKDVLSAEEFEASRLDGAGFDGGGDLINIACSLGAGAIGAFVAILRARLAQSKHVTIKVDGVEISGVDPGKVESILERLLAEKSS